MGAVTPIGNTVDETWEALLAGKNGIDFITSLDVSDLRIKIAAEVKNLEIENIWIRRKRGALTGSSLLG